MPPSLLDEARKAADAEGVALDHLITLALAEKVSALRTSEYFEERARRANPAKVKQILARVGKGMPKGFRVLLLLDLSTPEDVESGQIASFSCWLAAAPIAWVRKPHSGLLRPECQAGFRSRLRSLLSARL